MSGKSGVSDVLNDVKNAANVAARSILIATPTAIYQTSMKFSKDAAARENIRDIVSRASFFRLHT